MRLILGSQSPRRKEIMSFFSLPFEQATPPFDEEAIPFGGNPIEHVRILSQGKAAALAHLYPEAIIVTADTIVFKGGRLYEKPRSKEEGFEALSALSGRWHSVYTGITVSKGIDQFFGVEETRVLFNKVTPEQIHHYQEQLHCEDKAGGYAIQQAGAMIARRLEGCYYNVMGLPINTLRKLLAHVGIDLWNHLKPENR
jgi:septum formation protein